MHRVVIIGWRVIAVGLLLPIVWFNVQLWRDPIPAPELLETLEQDLEDGAGDDMQRMFPEGYVITHALVGFSWINIALQTTNTDDLEHAINRARWAEQRIDTEKARAIFPATLPLKHGAFYRGYLAWLRGGIVKASGENRRATDVDAFKWDCEAIATALRGSDSPYLESYKNAVWPADTVFAVAARQHVRTLLSIRHHHLASPSRGTV